MIVDQQPHELKKVDTVGTESSLESSVVDLLAMDCRLILIWNNLLQ